jgi:arginine N-succinyltransferase
MYVVRPVALADIAALEVLVAGAAQGVHTLPRGHEKVTRAVERSIASFAAEVDIQGEESYVFVLESVDEASGEGESDLREIIGTATIFATAGTNGTYFAFRNDVVQHVSRDLNISHNVHALTLCSELTAYSQLASFYVKESENAESENANADVIEAAALLSRARLLFAAIAPHRFNDRFFVSLAGMTENHGESPFWNALGRKFFQMDFLDAERLIEGARNRTLIVELMPPYPVYVPLLPGNAQAAMGQVHPDGALAFSLLTKEGFEADDYVDIFDGGPILLAHKKTLRTLQNRSLRNVEIGVPVAPQTRMLSNHQQHSFRAIHANCDLTEPDIVCMTAQVAQILGVVQGDLVLCVQDQG